MLDNPVETSETPEQDFLAGLPADFPLDTLMGDVRDAMLTRMRLMPRPWKELPQSEQQDLAYGIELAAKDIIRKTVGALNAHKWPKAVVKLEEVKIGGKELVAKITAQNIADHRDSMGEHVGDMCMLLMVDSETFFGEREPPQTDPDQPGLDLEASAADESGEVDPNWPREEASVAPTKPSVQPDAFFAGQTPAAGDLD